MDNLNVFFLIDSEPYEAYKDIEEDWFGDHSIQNQRFQSLIQRQKKVLLKSKT